MARVKKWRTDIQEFGSVDEAIDGMGWSGTLQRLTVEGGASAGLVGYVRESLARDTRKKDSKDEAAPDFGQVIDRMARDATRGAFTQLVLPFDEGQVAEQPTRALMTGLVGVMGKVWCEPRGEWVEIEALLADGTHDEIVAATRWLQETAQATRDAADRANWCLVVWVTLVDRLRGAERMAAE